MKIKFYNVLADREPKEEALEYLQEYKESLRGKVREGVNTLAIKEVVIDNEFKGYIASVDYNHKESKSRMLCVVDIHVDKELKEKVLDEFIRKNKSNYFSIYTWVDKDNIEELEFYKTQGAFICNDPTHPIRFTKDYKRPDIVTLEGRVACLFYEDKESYKEL